MLKIFDQTTSQIGAEFRNFVAKTCPAFETRELDREVGARKRRLSKKTQMNNAATGMPSHSAPIGEPRGQVHRLKKTFNLHTYKFHSLADYPATIRNFGTTDSYTTEIVSR
jgi:hypothetical protein